MIYTEANQIYKSLLYDKLPSNASSSIQVAANDFELSKEFYENFINKWLCITHAIKFNAKKLGESLNIHDSNPIIISILKSDQSLYQVSEEKFICKRNLIEFCHQLVAEIENNAKSALDLFKTESELYSMISNCQKKSIVSLVLSELKTNEIYNVEFYNHLGFLFPSAKYDHISKEKAQAILNAKLFLNFNRLNNFKENEQISLCESFLRHVREGEIDLETSHKINSICFNTQIMPSSTSSINFAQANEMISTKAFRLSKSSSNLSDYPITFKDIDIYIDDFKSLQGQNWINDKIIHFYGRIIENGHKDIFFIPPATVQYLRFCKIKEIPTVVSGWNLSKYTMVFIPFTNSDSLRNTGNHWSLLVWFPRHKNLFYHCDSCQQFSETSLKSAKSIVKRLISVCRLKIYSLKKVNVPQQRNSYDCGLYLLAYIEFLANKKTFQGMENEITQENINLMRSSIERKILSIREK